MNIAEANKRIYDSVNNIHFMARDIRSTIDDGILFRDDGTKRLAMERVENTLRDLYKELSASRVDTRQRKPDAEVCINAH